MTLARASKDKPARGGASRLPPSIGWRDLCDPLYADHVCSAVGINLANLVRHQYPTLLHEGERLAVPS